MIEFHSNDDCVVVEVVVEARGLLVVLPEPQILGDLYRKNKQPNRQDQAKIQERCFSRAR